MRAAAANLELMVAVFSRMQSFFMLGFPRDLEFPVCWPGSPVALITRFFGESVSVFRLEAFRFRGLVRENGARGVAQGEGPAKALLQLRAGVCGGWVAFEVALLLVDRSTNVGTSLLAVVLLSLLTLKWTEVTSVANYAYTSATFSSVHQQVWADDDGFGFGILGVPWCRSRANSSVTWTRAELLQELPTFAKVYATRPIVNNVNGMGFDHSFGLWFIARKLQPALAIESGVFKGHSTWILRQALPTVPIVALSPRHPQRYARKTSAIYVDSNCQYFTGKRFADFGRASWNSVLAQHKVEDPSMVLVFFDDHQNQLRRIEAAQRFGFQHLVFEDNYDTGTGDHYSMRQICDQYHVPGGGHDCLNGGEEERIRNERQGRWEKAVSMSDLCGADAEWWGVQGHARDDFGHIGRRIPHAQHFENGRAMGAGLDAYWEVPPVASPALTHQTRYDPARTLLPLLLGADGALFRELGLEHVPRGAFNGYTQMAYVKLRLQAEPESGELPDGT